MGGGGWGDWGDWGEVPQLVDECSASNVTEPCRQITIKGELYKESETSGKIKINWSAICCWPPTGDEGCGYPTLSQKVTIKIRTVTNWGDYWQEKTHTFSGASGSGDDWFDVEIHITTIRYECHGIVECHCGAFNGSASTMCKLSPP